MPKLAWKLGIAILASLSTLAVAPAFAGVSHTRFFQALGNDLGCGPAVHAPRETARILCSGTGVPAPASGVGFGDPGFVFLGAHGRPVLARLSQDEFESSVPRRLTAGRIWSDAGVTCTIHPSTVRCVNLSHHGFTVARHTYAAF
jgi:hypothetical protein